MPVEFFLEDEGTASAAPIGAHGLDGSKKHVSYDLSAPDEAYEVGSKYVDYFSQERSI